jgi:hypothetical protein
VGLELEEQALTAVHTLLAHLEALSAARQLVAVLLQPPQPSSSGGGHSSRGLGRLSSSGGLASSRHRLSSVGTSQQALWERPPPTPIATAAAAPARALLTCYLEWRVMQHHLLPLVAGAAERAEDEEGDAGAVGGGALDLSCQGLASLELLAGGSEAAILDLSSNALSRCGVRWNKE